MKTQEELEEDIRELLVLNNMDINIHNYPELIDSGATLGLDTGGLAGLVRQVYGSTDWRAYDRIYELLRNSEALAKGVFYEKDAKLIIGSVKEDLPAAKVTAFIISLISREPYYLKPRELTPPDWTSFRNCWMTDEAWQRHQLRTEPVEWCDETARSLEELGWILFRKKEASMEYLDSKLYLLPLVTLLTRSPARTQAFEKVFDNVKDKEIRYLIIIYKLNKGLPYGFKGKEYSSLRELMDAACKSHTAFVKLLSDFSKGYLHIWLKETEAPEAAFLGANLGKNSFLELLYKVNPHYPFYINKIKYASPAALVDVAKEEGSLWGDIYAAHDNRELSIWFTALEKEGWNLQLDKDLKAIEVSEFYNGDERRLAFVQCLINLIDDSEALPRICVTPDRLSFTDIESGKVIEANLRVELETGSFVKLRVYPERPVEGLMLDTEYVKLFSLTENTAANIKLLIDTSRLQKDTLYQTSFIVKSMYESISVPIEVSVTFPKRAYIKEMIKWALIVGIYYWLVGIIVPSIDISEVDTWSPEQFREGGSGSGFRGAFYLNYLALILLLAGLFFALRFIIQKYKSTRDA